MPSLLRPTVLSSFLRSSSVANSRRHASSLPCTIKPSIQEIATGRLGERNLETAMRSLHEDGLVVVADVVPHDQLDHLNAKMVADARTLQARGKDMPFNYNGRYSC